MLLSNVPVGVIHQVLSASGFQWGEVSITFMGLPLITYRLKKSDCIPLFHKLCSRLLLWINRFLSYSGRSQLICSILFAIQS